MADMFYSRLVDTCHELIYYDKPTFNYLTARGISASTIKKYKIDSFPRDLRLIFSKIHPKELAKNGIIWNAAKSRFNTPCLYPLVIPINDAYGRSVAIGCRTILADPERKKLEDASKESVPKYKNSEYKKTLHIFGLDKAKNAIKKLDCVFVVEGYFDVISAHQVGILNAVATCGTMFSRAQLAILSRYTNNICLMFDNDNPGHTSARKVIEKIDNDDLIKVNIHCKFTPAGFKDTDEYIRSGGDLSFFKEF